MMREMLLIAALGLVVTACGRSDVADRKRPDEFAVGRQAPLVIPPDFALQPPRPGAPRPIGSDSQQQALEALFGPGVQLPPRAEIENRLLEDARALRVESAVRNTAADVPGGRVNATVDKGPFLRELMDAPAGTRNEQIARVTVVG